MILPHQWMKINKVMSVGVSLPLMLPWIYCRQRGSQASISCASWTTAHTPREETHRRKRNLDVMWGEKLHTWCNTFKNISLNIFKQCSNPEENKTRINSFKSKYSLKVFIIALNSICNFISKSVKSIRGLLKQSVHMTEGSQSNSLFRVHVYHNTDCSTEFWACHHNTPSSLILIPLPNSWFWLDRGGD